VARSGWANSTNNGREYGNVLLLPLVGGSGGGGATPSADFVEQGYGGGAILIASNSKIEGASVLAKGGASSIGGHGSGGAIRLVAPVVLINGGTLQATGGGPGRIRIDTTNHVEFRGYPPGQFPGASYRRQMTVFPPRLPRLEIVEAAGVPVSAEASGLFAVQIVGALDATRTLKFRATDFERSTLTVEVVLTADQGAPYRVSSRVETLSLDPFVFTLPLPEVPAGTPVHVLAWAN
jgi:hypothetical protein